VAEMDRRRVAKVVVQAIDVAPARSADTES